MHEECMATQNIFQDYDCVCVCVCLRAHVRFGLGSVCVHTYMSG